MQAFVAWARDTAPLHRGPAAGRRHVFRQAVGDARGDPAVGRADEATGVLPALDAVLRGGAQLGRDRGGQVRTRGCVGPDIAVGVALKAAEQMCAENCIWQLWHRFVIIR